MPVLDINNREEVERYIKFTKTSKYATATQDMEWALVKKDWKSEHVYVERDGEIVAAMSLLIRSFVLGYTMIYATRGPVCDVYDTELVCELIKEVDKVAKKYKGFMLRFDPEVLFDKELDKKYRSLGFLVRNEGFGKSDLIQPKYNMILDIKDKTEEELMSEFSNKTRYNIRLSKRKGVTVYYDNSDEALKKFYEVYNTTAERNKIGMRPFDYFVRMRDAYKDELRVYLTEHEGDTLSGAVTINYGDKVWYAYGASSNEKRNLMPNYLMQWEMIKWGLETGAARYDFGGVFELNNNDGLYKFKEGFCRKIGATEFIGEIDKVYNKTMYFAFTKVIPKIQSMRVKRLRNKK